MKATIKKRLGFVLAIAFILIGIFIYLHQNKGLFNDEGANANPGQNSPAHSDMPAPTCSDKIQNQGERHVDCGGPCTACPPDCTDGIKNQDETAIDCGGKICPACPTCSDKIQNQGERHVDCDGPCTACPPDCTDGIKNQDETAIDCGGKICPACPSCSDKIQNQGEAGVDCGGPCSACPIITALTADEVSKVKNAILSSAFIKDLPNTGIIALHFFNYQYGQRVELDTFLIGKDQILSSGTPDMTILLHTKYIAELTPTNLCEIIPKANTNGDLGVDTTLGEAKLLIKYSGMMKYRDCFGF
jgi:hypothetical protein